MIAVATRLVAALGIVVLAACLLGGMFELRKRMQLQRAARDGGIEAFRRIWEDQA